MSSFGIILNMLMKSIMDFSWLLHYKTFGVYEFIREPKCIFTYES